MKLKRKNPEHLWQFVVQQHIYADQLNVYATVAASPEIGTDLRGQIERHVQSAPDADTTIYRCYPLDGADCTALSFVAPRTGARRSHIAQTYVLPNERLAEIGWNLAWVAMHLPFLADYRPPPRGIAELAPMTVEIKRAGHIRMLRWLHDQVPSPGLVADWQAGLLTAISEHKSIRLGFGPAPKLAEVSREVLGKDPPARADLLNLWRTAGLLALIPGRFQERLSFTINEDSDAEAGLSIVLEAEGTDQPHESKELSYLTQCYEFLKRGEDSGLLDFLDQVDQHLGKPSISALDAVVQYVLAPPVDPSDPEARASRLLGCWEHVKSTTGPEEAMGLLRELDLALLPVGVRLYRATMDHVFSGGTADASMQSELLDRLLDWNAELADQQQLIGHLSGKAKAALWQRSEERRLPPARVGRAVDFKRAAIWTDALFSGLTSNQRDTATGELGGVLREIANPNPMRGAADSDPVSAIHLFIELGDVLDHRDSELSEHLAKQLADVVPREGPDQLGNSDYPETILDCASGSDGRSDLGAMLATRLAEKLWNEERTRERALDYVLALPDPNDLPRIRFCHRLCRQVWDHAENQELRQTAAAQRELLDLLMGKDWGSLRSGNDPSCRCPELLDYKRWLPSCEPTKKSYRGKPQERHSYTRFHQNLRRIVERWPLIDAMCISLLYLHTDPYKKHPPYPYSTTDLYTALLRRTCRNDGTKEEVKHWLSGSGQDSRAGRSDPGWSSVSDRVSPWAMLALYAAILDTRKGDVWLVDLGRQLLRDTIRLITESHSDQGQLEACFKSLGVSRKLLRSGFS